MSLFSLKHLFMCTDKSSSSEDTLAFMTVEVCYIFSPPPSCVVICSPVPAASPFFLSTSWFSATSDFLTFFSVGWWGCVFPWQIGAYSVCQWLTAPLFNMNIFFLATLPVFSFKKMYWRRLWHWLISSMTNTEVSLNVSSVDACKEKGLKQEICQ